MGKATHIVTVNVTDLRREPVEPSFSYAKDPLEESQLLFGERVRVLEERQGWYRIEALEQMKWAQNSSWIGYPGWIKASDVEPADGQSSETSDLVVTKSWSKVLREDNQVFNLSFGTSLSGLEKKGNKWIVALPDGQKGTISASHVNYVSVLFSRQKIIKLGRLFLGFPYLWGGRSAYDPQERNVLTSVDCSGYVNLLYRSQGMQVPRDAHDQFLFSNKIRPEEMKLGDLVFMSSMEKPERMGHVMLYAGGEMLLESTIASGNVREISVKDRFGCSLCEMPYGGHNGSYHFYYGSFF